MKVHYLVQVTGNRGTTYLCQVHGVQFYSADAALARRFSDRDEAMEVAKVLRDHAPWCEDASVFREDKKVLNVRGDIT